MSQLPSVVESARYVVERAGLVTVDQDAVRRWARGRPSGTFETPAPPRELQFSGSPDESANLILLLDCLNFCFWSDQPWTVEYRGRPWKRTYAMYAAVLRAVECDRAWLDAQRWAEVNDRQVAELFAGRGQIPLLEKRRAVLNETGAGLLQSFDGQFSNAVGESGRNAKRLSYLLADELPSFRDVATYRGRTVAFLKRAQICAADLHHCWVRQGHPGLIGLDELTVFADYRLPQYLRHVGILRMVTDLAAPIDAEHEIPAGSEAEVELRAATIVACERIIEALRDRGVGVAPWQLDYFLWERSHDAEVSVPHHRTRTIFY